MGLNKNIHNLPFQKTAAKKVDVGKVAIVCV